MPPNKGNVIKRISSECTSDMMTPKIKIRTLTVSKLFS